MIGIDKESANRLLMFSAVGVFGGGAFAKLNNKNIFLGAGLGLIIGIGSLYGFYKIDRLNKATKIKKEAELTKNMTQEQKNQYAISKGGKAPVAL